MQHDLTQARMAVSEMAAVVGAIHSSTAEHHARLKKLQARLAKLGARTEEGAWQELCCEIEAVLGPTLKLVGEIASAQECIRYHSTHLQRFSELQSDPLTGVSNRRALEGMVAAQFGLLKRYDTPFSLAIVDIDNFKDLNDQRGHLHGDEALRDLASLIAAAVRTVDVVARYGGDEFVVVMPQTDLDGAGILADRLRQRVVEQMPFSVSVGVATAGEADTPESLFQRADAALYRSKSEGRNRTHRHLGRAIEPIAAAAPSLPLAVAASPSEQPASLAAAH
jgi:diguanylate cyclase